MMLCVGNARDCNICLPRQRRFENFFVLQTTSDFYLFLFWLDPKKKQKKSRQSPIPPGVFAILRLPRCNSVPFYLLACCVIRCFNYVSFFGWRACAVYSGLPLRDLMFKKCGWCFLHNHFFNRTPHILINPFYLTEDYQFCGNLTTQCC